MTLVAKPGVAPITKALALAGAFVAFGCGGEAPPAERADGKRLWVHQGEAQGTTYTIKYLAADSVPQAAFEASLEEVDVEMNAWRAESALSRFNAFGRTDTVFEVTDPAGVWSLLWDISTDVHRESQGAFDVSVAPLMNLWGFRMQHRDVVTPEQVDSVRAFARFRTDVVDYNDVFDDEDRRVAGHLSKGDPRVALDFNAVAQGYTVDGLAEVLLDHGVEDMMVELGGEVKCLGRNMAGDLWRIAIDRPQAVGRTLQAVLALDNTSICTSGNYRKVSVVNGQKLSHTLDPRTGVPVSHGLLSATVVTPSAAYADAYATVCMVLGPDRGAAWVDSLQRAGKPVEALFILDGGEGEYAFWATPSMREQLEWFEELPEYDLETPN
ncbi:MAG: FAD:protein FMN transferase [Flavobacteriales bacterium]